MALTTVTIGQKGGTLRGTTGHGYVLTFPSSKTFVSAFSHTGTFWVKPFSITDKPLAADPTNAAVPAVDTATDSIEIKSGDVWSNGVSSVDGVRQLTGVGGAVISLAIWCELAGDLIVVLQ
jgi:hypothetical protein